jgi:hypothetical protein
MLLLLTGHVSNTKLIIRGRFQAQNRLGSVTCVKMRTNSSGSANYLFRPN